MTTTSTKPSTHENIAPIPLINADGSPNVDRCECTNPKMAVFLSCKACAVHQGRYAIEVQPHEEPCPICGDGKNPSFTLCTNCATERRYINHDRKTNPQCPPDHCECGATKPAAYKLCYQCHQDQTRFISIHEASNG